MSKDLVYRYGFNPVQGDTFKTAKGIFIISEIWHRAGKGRLLVIKNHNLPHNKAITMEAATWIEASKERKLVLV